MSSHKSELQFSWSVVRCFSWYRLSRLEESWQKCADENPTPTSLCAWGCASCSIRCRINFTSAASSLWGLGNAVTIAPATAGLQKLSSLRIWLGSSVLFQAVVPLLVGCHFAPGQNRWQRDRAVNCEEECTAMQCVPFRVGCWLWWTLLIIVYISLNVFW